MANGYNPAFLGPDLTIPLPAVQHPDLRRQVIMDATGTEPLVSNHTNFSVIQNHETRLPVIVAHNIDQDAFLGGKRKDKWLLDEGFEEADQLPEVYYDDDLQHLGESHDNYYDIGHMVPFANARYGPDDVSALAAGQATFVLSNAAPQHENLNRAEWRYLEQQVVRRLKIAEGNKLCVFTGPIFGPLDRSINISSRTDPARAPSGFFKVICFRLADPPDDNPLGVLTFAIFQERRVIQDDDNNRVVKTDQRFQITIMELEKLTGLKFDPAIGDRNPLIYTETTRDTWNVTVRELPENRVIGNANDIIRRITDIRDGELRLSERPVSIVAAMIWPEAPERDNEWVSLFNRTSSPISIQGWTLTDHKGRTSQLTGQIDPGTAICLDRARLGSVRLTNSGGNLVLRDRVGRVVDYASWNQTALRRVGRGTAYQFEVGQ